MRWFAPVALVLVAMATAVAALAAPYWHWGGGLVEIEATTFVRQYLDDRTLPQKVFDPHANDWDAYQAREPSYLADYLDARVLEAFMAAGRRVFIPASAWLSALLTLAVSWLAVRRMPRAAWLPAALLLLVYVTNYVHLRTMGIFYRSSIPLLTPVLMAAVYYLVAVLRPWSWAGERRPPARWAPAAVFVLLSLMGVLHRQGFFYAAAGVGAMALHARLAGGRRDVVVAGVAALAGNLAYDLVIGPWLIEAINGYSPSFEYQRLPWRDVLTAPMISVRSALLMLEALAALLGGLPPWACAVVLLAGVGLVRRHLPAPVVVVGLGIGFTQYALGALMIARIAVIYFEADNRVWYYPLPFQAIVIALLVTLAGAAATTWSSRRLYVASAVLALVAVANVLRWDDYDRAQAHLRWTFELNEQNAALRSSLAEGRPSPMLLPEYRAFYEFWR